MNGALNEPSSYLHEWTFNPRVEILAGVVVALALIPEAIGFSVVAGVSPETGLYGSAIISCVIAITGGRPAMISAATASTAVLMGPLVRAHGTSYLFAATVLMGMIQITAGLLHVERLMRFVSRSVLTGFANALAILIFLAQIPQLVHVSSATYALVATGLLVIYGLPCLTKAVPSPLVAVTFVTVICTVFGIDVRSLADLGRIPTSLPEFSLPHIPLTFETLLIITPTAFALAAVGLLESLLTAKIVDDRTDTSSDNPQECIGQGIANVVAPLFGGMGGCAMIGQSIINVSSGARGRLSAFSAGVSLIILLVVLHRVLVIAPVAGLTAVMIMVSINTFSWKSLVQLRRVPWQSTVVMVATVLTVLATSDLSKGVLVGVVLSCVFFVAKVSRLEFTSHLSSDGRVRRYVVQGQLFFATAEQLTEEIDLNEDVEQIVVDVTGTRVWDITAGGATDQLVLKAHRLGRTLEFIGLDSAPVGILTPGLVGNTIHDPHATDR